MVRTASGGGEGGGGGGGKFVSVNLNKSYGLPSPPSASSASPSSSSSSTSAAVRFSSRLPKQGGMVLLSRPGLRLPPATSPGPASSKLGAGGGASAAVGTPKLSVPLPVNLPSLRSQHGGNDPSVTLTCVGPAVATAATASLTGWSRQPQEQSLPLPLPLPLEVEGAGGSDAVGPGNRPRVDAYAPPGARRTSVATNPAAPPSGGGPLVLERASVVLKGEDFPTLKAASTPSVIPPALPPPQTKQQPKERPAKLKEAASEPAFPPLEPPPPPLQVLKKEEPRPPSPPKSLDGSWRKQGPGLPPPPLTRLSRTSDWDDDERETSQTLLHPPKETHHPEDALGSSSSNSNRGGAGGHSTTWSRNSSGYGRDGKDENNSRELNGFNRGLESSKEFGHPLNRAAPKESGVGHFSRDYIDRTGEHRREGAAVAAHVWDGGFAKESSFNSSRYAVPRREPNGLNKPSSGDWLGKSAERFGSYAPRPSPTEKGRKAEFNNDARRASFAFDKPRIESSSFQNTDFAASLRGGYGDSSMDPFGLDVKVIRKKREESERRNLRDPERESFEAELERVQSMLEQERRRVAEEQERAVEVARKEQEERERLAREEEELRLKMEEEAREAAAELEREAIEAAAKAERDRKAREEEKHKDVIEEERRKEAARKKLLELEERIAKREVERKREEEERKRRDESASNYNNQQSQDQATWEDKELHQHPFPVTVSRLKQDDDDDQGDEQNQLRESSNGNHSRPTSSETMPYPADYRVDQADVLGSQSLSSQRRLHVENERRSFQAPSVLTSPGQNDFGANSNNKWRPNRGFPSREAAPNAVPNHSSQESSQWESFVRGGRLPDSNEQRRNAKKDPYNSLLPLSEEDPSPHMLGSSYEREGDCEWDRSNGLNSFSPSPYLRGVDSIDSLSTGRARLALSKQPRVPPPPVIQASPWRPQPRVEEQQPLASAHTEVSVTKPSGYEVSSPLKVGFEDEEVEKVSEGVGGIEEEEEIWETLEPDSQRVSPELDSDNNEEVIGNPPRDIRTDGGDEVPIANSGELQISEKGERSDGMDYEEDWGVEEGGVDDYDADLGEEEEDEEEEEDQEIEGVEDSVKPSHDYEEDRAADVSEGEYEEGNTDDEEEGGNKAENRIGEAPLPHLNEDPGKEMEKSCVSEEVRDEVAALNLGLPLFSDSIGSVEAMGNVGPVRHTPLGQQFQTPFSFMAVPLPQSNSSNAPPSLLPPPPSNPVPNPGLPTQPDIPFQLHFGLLPGAPLLPSAIQIGTIQMPLHLHSPVPQLTAHHLHTSQPPLFQFGQIGHSGPFTQPPATMFPPSMHIHHPMSQPPPQISHPQPSFNHSDVSMYPSPNEDIRLPSPNENAPAQNQDPLLLEDSSSNSVEPSLGLPSNPGEVAADVLVEDPNQEGFQANNNPPSEQFAGKESRSSRSSGGAQLNTARRRGISSGYRGGLAPSGRGGRGGSRFGNTNNGFEAWGFENNGRKIGGGTGERFVRNRPPRRSFRRAEFKMKEPYSQNPSDIPSFGRQQQQWEEEHYQQTSSNVAPPYSDYRDSQFNQGGRTANRRSSAIDERTYNGGAYHNSRVDQSGGRNGNNAGIMKPTTKAVGMPSNHPSVVRPPVKATNSGLSSNRRYSDTRNHVGREAFSDAPLQSGVVHVFEQPGIEIPNNDDDFIEVRSKRQMLNDKREQREKEIKSRNKEAKLSEHGLRKQQRASKSIQQADTTALEMNSAQSGEKHLSLQNSDMETANIDVKQPAPTAMPQTRPSTVQPPLAPIGTPALVSSDAPEKKAKGPRPVHANPLPGSNQVSTDGPTSEIHAGIRDKAINPTSAWGGQRPTCQPVSLTQIQLEEVMKPRFEGPLSQQRSSSERPIRAIEPTGIPAAGMISHEKVTATVPGPVASLLAGEKIQFGAVTLPPIILPSTQSHTPSMPPTVVSSLSSDVKSMVGPVENSPFPSRGKRARGNEEKSRDAADVEAEAAASAVAAAVISSDEFIGSACPSDSRSNPLVRMVTPVSGSSFAKPDGCSTDVSGVATTLPSGSLVPAVEDSVALSLPADLSVEGPPLMLRGPLHSGQGSSGLMLPPLSGVVSPFPCLEMGPMLSGPPFFSLAPSEDALSMPQGMKQACTLPGMGPGSINWQQRHSTGVDSFYSGQPSVFPGPFIGPAGGVPGIQGPAHMLVYTNPFASVGQYGQLGVSFMGTTYLPSGKQPDWKHTPILTSSPGESHLSEGEMGGNSLGGMMSQPGNSTVVNPAQQQVGLSGSSVMPVSPHLGLFDLSLSAPFQMPNTETMTEPQWPYVPQSVPISGPVMGHLMQSWNFGGLPNQMPPLSQMMTQGNPPGLHSIPSPKPTPNNNNNTLPTDAATRFPAELGLDPSSLPSNMASLATVGSRLPMPSKESTAPSPTSTALNNNKLPRHRRPLRGTRGMDLADNANNPSLDVVGMVSSNGSAPNVGHNKAMGGGGYEEGRFPSQQGGTARGGVGNEWPSSGNHHRKGMGGGGGRAPSAEKPFALPSKMKQVYVAKAVAPPLPPRVESSQQDTPGNVFSL